MYVFSLNSPSVQSANGELREKTQTNLRDEKEDDAD